VEGAGAISAGRLKRALGLDAILGVLRLHPAFLPG
jgi:hypothetical protein